MGLILLVFVLVLDVDYRSNYNRFVLRIMVEVLIKAVIIGVAVFGVFVSLIWEDGLLIDQDVRNGIALLVVLLLGVCNLKLLKQSMK